MIQRVVDVAIEAAIDIYVVTGFERSGRVAFERIRQLRSQRVIPEGMGTTIAEGVKAILIGFSME